MEDANNGTNKRSEEAIKRQILTNARKALADLARKNVANGNEYVSPTTVEINAECKKRWQQHLDRMKAPEDLSMYFD